LTREKYDVVIIGGGPAGSSAARMLSRKELKVCVIDKSTFPRDKLCGGLLTLRSKRIFENVFQTTWDPIIEVISRGVQFFHNSRFLTSVSNYKDLHFVSRSKFDDYLLHLAKQSGAMTRLGSGAKSVDVKNNEVELFDGTVLTADFIIGADGVNSTVAKSLYGKAFTKKTIAFGLEMEVPIGNKYSTINDPEIYLGVAKWGYAWVFPKRLTLTVGIAGLWRKNPNLKADLCRFLSFRFRKPPNSKIKGHYIPFGDYRSNPGINNILLCGDAAGLVEPITGEGIAFAIQSGCLAAQSIIEAASISEPIRAYDFYKTRYRAITRIFDHANALRYLIFPKASEYLFVNVLPKSKSIPRKHLDLMSNEIDYRDYELFLLRKSAKCALNKIIPMW
jgi:geranylgeranyl reductase family protein